jgi:hypothetical protein
LPCRRTASLLTALPDGCNLRSMYLPRFALIRRHAALAALALVVMAAAWLFLDSKWFQGSGFATLTPWEHYDWAMRLLHPRTKKLFGSGDSIPWVAEPTTDDLKNAIRHLEAIPPDSDAFTRGAEVLPPPVYVRATKLLPLLRLRRDQARDYLALEEARYRSCIAEAHSGGTSICTTGLAQRCAPLAGSDRIAQLKALVPFR